jgi:hypothetical protein
VELAGLFEKIGFHKSKLIFKSGHQFVGKKRSNWFAEAAGQVNQCLGVESHFAVFYLGQGSLTAVYPLGKLCLLL